MHCSLITRRAAPTQHIRHTSLFLESYIIPEYVNELGYTSQKCEKSNRIHTFFALNLCHSWLVQESTTKNKFPVSFLLLLFESFDILSLISVEKSELSGVWGKKLFESDEKKRKDEQSVPSFSSPNAFNTFGTKSMENSIRKNKWDGLWI